MIVKECCACGEKPLDKDTIGINKKMLGKNNQSFYCMNCLADYLDCSVEDLLDLTDQKYFDSEDCSTNKNNIFVAGDCRNKSIRQLTTAVSDGTTAAVKAIKYLEDK